MPIFVILLVIFTSFALGTYVLLPILSETTRSVGDQQARKVLVEADFFMQDKEIKKARTIILILPALFGGAGYLLMRDFPLVGLGVGLVLGIVFPRIHIRSVIEKRKQKFQDQLVDALMIMSSSFRGGLSLVQAIEAVVEEMQDPVRQEFGIVLGENKMGVTMDESLNRLYKRMPSPAMQQMVTAILLARETGGNLPIIFSRIIGTMRERKKVEQNLRTLTVQGKIQAMIMTGLPIFFIFGVTATQPGFFDHMLNTPDGQKLILLSAVLWTLGALSIWKISTMKDI